MVTLAAVSGWQARSWLNRSAPDGSESRQLNPSVEQLQTLSSLVTARVEVADVVVSRLDGYTGGEEIALVIKGDFLIGTDLSKASFEQIDRAARRAVLVLAQPAMTSPRVDLTRTRLYGISESGLWQITPGDDRIEAAVIDRGYARAQEMVAGAGGQPENLTRARLQAESVLRGFFTALGWTVSIQWSR